MIPLYRQNCTHIEINNDCNLRCNNCTRFVGKHKTPYYMTLDNVNKAVDTLIDAPMSVGIMGGEPTMHPQFREICWALTKIPKERRSLWTNGYKYKEYLDVIDATFLPENIIYNDHKEEIDFHQPLNYKISEILKDEPFLAGLLCGNCWVQWRWSSSVVQDKNGRLWGYFCEVAAARAVLNDDHYGYKIEKNWWRKDPNEFLQQAIKYCSQCSGALPIQPQRHNERESTDHPVLSRQDIMNTIKKGWYPYRHRKKIKTGENALAK